MNRVHQPILVGVGQRTNHADVPGEVREPLRLMAEAAQLAAEDAQAPRLLADLDSLTVIQILSRSYPDPAGQLASLLGAHPGSRNYTTVGGNSPQWQVNEIVGRIANGEVRLALIAGAEAFHGLKVARRAGVELDWSPEGSAPAPVGESRWGTNEVEQRHHAMLPAHIYPLFENAIRAHRGVAIDDHRLDLAKLCAAFAAVAKDNPHAWFREGRTASEIAEVSAGNRMIAFPYTKFMNAIMDVDQSAALLLTNVETARQYGIPEGKWIYPWGAGDANDHWYVSERVNYHSSSAIRLAGERALAQAGLAVADIDFLDLYSCFPSAVQIAADMLGIAGNDPRPLTCTGGLPYHGGPGNNYVAHSIATMVETLRAHPGATGLVTAVGWYLTKHSIGIYASAPPKQPWSREPPAIDQARVDAEPHPEIALEGNGEATVETYTVTHDRDGYPSLGIVIARLPDGRRCWANITDPNILEQMERVEFVGRTGQVRYHASTQVNSFEP